MKRIIIIISAILVISTVVLTGLSLIAVVSINKGIDYETDEALFMSASRDSTTYYYAYDGVELREVWKSTRSSKREWCDLEDVGEYLKNGFIAMEDRGFYSHNGINVKRTALAAFNYVFKLKDEFGASTITQQVVKNISGDDEDTVKRKLAELMRAMHLERRYSKDDIFELYLNLVPMSGNMYGVSIASEAYFGKEPSELALHEAATIVGITNAPTLYNPYLNPERCVEKRNRVLYAMREVGSIDEQEYRAALAEPLTLCEKDTTREISSWFVETVREDVTKDLMDAYNLTRPAATLLLNGARVVTTMNVKIQNVLDDFFENEGNLSSNVSNGLNYSMVVSDPYTGDLLGIIGGAGRKGGEMLYNYATNPITPGSVLKPLALYAPAIDRGLVTWSTRLFDAPVRYLSDGVAYPKNSPDVYEGYIDVNYALKRSKNTAAIQLFDMLGAENIFNELVNAYGFDTLVESVVNSKGQSVTDVAEAPLALGQLSYGVSLRKLTEAYNVFPNNGELCGSKSYYYVLDRDGDEILKTEASARRIMSAAAAQVMTQMLKGVVDDGTARRITLKELVDTAGKTGTSGADRDRLFIGFTPYFTAGIWCGYPGKLTEVGANTPSHLEIWDEIMKRIYRECVGTVHDDEQRAFATDSIILQPYCDASGLIPTHNCELSEDSSILYGYYKADYLPPSECNFHNDIYKDD